jgi:hypothetical protein
MDLSSTRKRSLNSIIKGLCEAGSGEIEQLNIPEIAKKFLNTCVKGVEDIAHEELIQTRTVIKKIDEKKELDEAKIVTRPKDPEPEIQETKLEAKAERSEGF